MSKSPHRRQRSPVAHHPSRQRRPGPALSAPSAGRPQVVSLLNLQPTAGSRPSGPSIATTQSPRSPSHNIPQRPYLNNYRSPYLGHPAFPSFAHVEAMRFPPAIHYPPQGARPPRTHMPYMPSTSPVGVPILPPLGAPSYLYPPPQQFPPFSTPVSPYIHPQRPSDWAPIPCQRPPTTTQRSDSSLSDSQVSSTPISSVSPIHTQPPESLEAATLLPAAGNMLVVDQHQQQRRLFSSAPVPSREEQERPVEIPTRPSSAPAVFPVFPAATAPHDARSRPTVPVTQYLDATESGGQLGPDLPNSNSRTTGRRHKQ